MVKNMMSKHCHTTNETSLLDCFHKSETKCRSIQNERNAQEFRLLDNIVI